MLFVLIFLMLWLATDCHNSKKRINGFLCDGCMELFQSYDELLLNVLFVYNHNGAE